MESNQIIFYTSPKGNTKIEVIFEEDSFWLTQKAMAQLFNVQRPAITKHLNRIFENKELIEESICSKMEHIGSNGYKYPAKYYRIEAILVDTGKIAKIDFVTFMR